MTTSRHQLHYCKTKTVDLGDFDDSYKLSKLQQYNPLLSVFFTLTEKNYNHISLNHRYHIINDHQVGDMQSNKKKEVDIFIKFAPLLDPIKYMIGKYDSDATAWNLPKLLSTKETCHSKLLDCCNASYVDNFFYYLSSILLNHHDFPHGLNYYGSFLGIQEKFKMNIDNDIEYLQGSEFFINNLNKLMTVENFEFSEKGSRKYQTKIIIDDIPMEDLIVDEMDEMIFPESDESALHPYSENMDIDIQGLLSDPSEIITLVKSDKEISEHDDDEDDENNSLTNYSTVSEYDVQSHDSSQDDDVHSNKDDIASLSSNEDDSYSDYGEVTVSIHDFPVQMIILEKCEKTLDYLFENNLVDVENGASILFQIIMILLVYQKTFHFTHNDLHADNIMYIPTKKQFLYYKFNDVCYKVPTYGRIFKIIDFGRSIYEYEGRRFCSDSFSPSGDGSTQYNCEPYINSTKPIIEPNYSFDLCRLGCSLYDSLIDEDTDMSSLNQLQSTIYRWITDDLGKNIVYKKNGSERYPGFKLYKMISRKVHLHTPIEQLKDPYFEQFSIHPRLCKVKSELFDIDQLIVYASKDTSVM